MLEPLSESVGHLSKSIRSISHSLNNQLLLQQDLFKAIVTEVERLQKNAKIDIQFLHDESITKVFTANEKIILYRIFQEIINNSLKHSKAKAITIRTQATPTFSLMIKDNGKGFDLKSTVIGKQTLGLQSISNRAEIVNYTLQIDSKLGEGTTITLTDTNPVHHG
jgi:signal transduction histidine kinase